MNRVDDIIGLWPSMAELGRDLGLPYPTVAAWKQRGSIPVAYWRELVGAAQRRGFREVNADLLIAAHDHETAGPSPGGFADDPVQMTDGRDGPPARGDADGQFSRWKALRRAHFASVEEVVDHVRALRDEWDRR